MEQTSNVNQEAESSQAQHDGAKSPQNLRTGEFKNVGEAERYSSILGGLGLILAGLSRRGIGAVALGALGAALIQRGVTGHCSLYSGMGVNGTTAEAETERSGVPDNVGIKLERSVVINRPREELFAFWRYFPNLTRAMKHVERIDLLNEKRSHWVIQTPRGRRIEWDAVVINEHPNEMIAWESLPGAKIENAGTVRFDPEPHGEGTVVTVKLEYNPPGGLFGRLGATLLGEKAGKEIEEDLNQLKNLMESGELVEKQG